MNEENLEKYFQNVKIDDRVMVSGNLIDVPVRYPELSAVMGLFPISINAAKSLITVKRIKPVSILRGQCLLGITIFDFIECPVGPYRELALSIPVMLDQKISIPFLPLVLRPLFKNFGFYTVLLAMNTEMGIGHSDKIFGYPTYQKKVEIEITKSSSNIFIKAEENDKSIITMNMGMPQHYKFYQGNFHTYFTNRHRELIKVEMSTAHFMGYSIRKKNFKLEIGDSPISNIIKELKIKPVPLEYIHYRKAIEILSSPQEI